MPQKNRVQKDLGKKILVPKILCRKDFGSRKILRHKRVSVKTYGQKKILGPKSVWSGKILGQTIWANTRAKLYSRVHFGLWKKV